MYHFEKKTLKNLEIFERKKMGLFEKVTRKANAPSSKNFFFLKIFLFFGKDLEILRFFLRFKIYIYIYIYKYIYINEQSTSNATRIFRI